MTTTQAVLSGTFFHWVDKPICTDCGTMTESNGGAHPTEEERRWLAGRVELYKCPNCGKDERFPRYNHPRKLLGKFTSWRLPRGTGTYFLKLSETLMQNITWECVNMKRGTLTEDL